MTIKKTASKKRVAAKSTTDKSGAKVGSRRSNAVRVKPPPPMTRRGRATRQRLKEALTRLLQEHAFHEIRLEDITREAGVRVSLFYHYFPSKTDITQEVLSDLLDRFRDEVSERPRSDSPLETIHYANQRMVALYRANPGAMRCLLEVDQAKAPFAPMWRELTLAWNRRIAASIRRQAPDAFKTDGEYLALAYALAGTADSFLFEFFVQKNQALQETFPDEEAVAVFLTTLWYRSLHLVNPPDNFLGTFAGFRKIGLSDKEPSC